MRESGTTEDAALLARAIAGDGAALEQLLVPFQSRLFSRLSRRIPLTLAGVVSPEDLLQETYLEIFRQIRQFQPRGRGAFVRWVLMVADGRLIQSIRTYTAAKRGGGRIAVDPTLSTSSALDLLELARVDPNSPSRAAAGNEIESAVYGALESLKSEYRDAVRMRFLEGLSIADVASRLGRSEWSVHKLCNRGLRQLREILGDPAGFLSRR